MVLKSLIDCGTKLRFGNHETWNRKKEDRCARLTLYDQLQLLERSGGGSGQKQLSAVSGRQADTSTAVPP
ncbi:MAG TPA: hypothetical protein VG759_18975, partial [Candidatus Angelobacter sp.]|nr:hypothetical protein [Candidatus Angelobacter sp.]